MIGGTRLAPSRAALATCRVRPGSGPASRSARTDLYAAALPALALRIESEQRLRALRLIGVLIDADDDRLPRVDRHLRLVGRILDLPLNEPGFDGRQRAAHRIDSIDQARRRRARSRRSAARSRTSPPTGSTVFTTPVSRAMICCVRSARRADSSVGSASASSRPLQCSDCVPPSTAASAWTATRTTLLSGCCAVSVLPAVWV